MRSWPACRPRNLRRFARPRRRLVSISRKSAKSPPVMVRRALSVETGSPSNLQGRRSAISDSVPALRLCTTPRLATRAVATFGRDGLDDPNAVLDLSFQPELAARSRELQTNRTGGRRREGGQ